MRFEPSLAGLGRSSSSKLPVYKMLYRKYGGGTKELRLEWNHEPDETSFK